MKFGPAPYPEKHNDKTACFWQVFLDNGILFRLQQNDRLLIRLNETNSMSQEGIEHFLRDFQALKPDTCMDFLERIFGITPDGGNGSFELLLLLIPLAGILLLRTWRNSRYRLK